MTIKGKQKKQIQTYKCERGHFFRVSDIPKWDDDFIERVVFIYLQCLSLNTTITLVREFYQDDVLTKGLILNFIEKVADKLPTIDEIDNLYHPVRSGYLAFDGVWFQFGIGQIVLHVAFDPETFDIVGAIWVDDETEKTYSNRKTKCQIS